MSAVIVIPARHASTRLPGKPLLKQTGKYLIQHVYERASQAKKARAVLVATDDTRIVAAVDSFGGGVFMTRKCHPSGTDRVAEVAALLGEEVIVNLQGDEPLIDPAALDLVIGRLEKDATASMATLACPLAGPEQYNNPNCVKVVTDDDDNALYFSRGPIPWVRDGRPDFAARPARFLQHVGLYAYRREMLAAFAAAAPSPLERLEKLEQLRALAMGCKIAVGRVDQPTLGVDTYEDYQRFVAIHRLMQAERAAAVAIARPAAA
jgi:3-deoxy-manno-octulosonate cytidylyltransferase (CMP-KDO synthetase)